MKVSLLGMSIGICLLTGCATNPVAKFYQDCTKQMPVALQQRLLPPAHSEPRIIPTTPGSQRAAQAREILKQGYILIGFTAYRGSQVEESQLIQQAKKTGAEAWVLSGEGYNFA